MKNIVYVIAIIFWILSMIAKSRKKQQQVAERERARNLTKRVGKRKETAPKKAPLFSDDVTGVFTKQASQEPKTDYESAYASSDYTEAIVERTSVRSDGLLSAPITEDSTSHYRKNYGMASSLGTESSEEKEAYDKDKKVIPKFTFGDSAIKQYIIASEILGKPKALRR
ncbi:MAG: hypothetical protein ACHQM6_10685 [Candidatus Kapaibacterium sp.]